MRHRREDIIDAAIAAIDENGVGIATAAIAKAAGVSNGTLFNHFPTKADLFDSIYVELKTELGEAIGVSDAALPTRDQWAQTWERWVVWSITHSQRARVVRLLHEAGVVSDAAVEAGLAPFLRMRDRFQQAQAEGEIVDLPIDYLGAIVQQHIELTAQFALTESQRERAFDSLWASLAAPAATGSGDGSPTQRGR